VTASVRRRAITRLGVTLGVVALFMASLPATPVAAATDRLPDLRAASIRDLRITTSGGRRLLRFTSIMWNQGAGPFEVRANRSSSTTSNWDVDQIVCGEPGAPCATRRSASASSTPP
jgi:hypothetical protein